MIIYIYFVYANIFTSKNSNCAVLILFHKLHPAVSKITDENNAILQLAVISYYIKIYILYAQIFSLYRYNIAFSLFGGKLQLLFEIKI